MNRAATMEGLQAEAHQAGSNAALMKALFQDGLMLVPDYAGHPLSSHLQDPASTAEAVEVMTQTAGDETMPSAPMSVLPKSTRRYLGGNADEILVLVDSDDALDERHEQYALLMAILGAVNRNLAHVAIGRVHLANELIASLAPRMVVAFAEMPNDWPLGEYPDLYQPKVHGATQVLASAPLSLLQEDVNHKRQLWRVLKGFFQNQE